MPELGGSGEQLGGLLAVDGARAAGEMEHGEREHRLTVAARDGELYQSVAFLSSRPTPKPWA